MEEDDLSLTVPSPYAGWDFGLVAAGLGALGAAFLLPWSVSRAVGDESTSRLIDLAASRWLFVACATAIAVTIVVQRLRGASEIGDIAMIGAATIVAAVPAMAIVAIELVSLWLAPERLPSTFRRLTVGAKPMPGIWLTLFAGTLLVLGALRCGHTIAAWLAALRDGLAGREARAWSAVLLLAGLPALAIARYGEWLEVDSSVDSWSISGWALPWIGLITLALLIMASALGVVSIARPSVGRGSSLSVMGWAITLVSGLLVTITSAVPTLRAPEWFRVRLTDLSNVVDDVAARSPVTLEAPVVPKDLRIDPSAGWGSIVAFIAGLVVMAAGIAVCRAASDGTVR